MRSLGLLAALLFTGCFDDEEATFLNIAWEVSECGAPTCSAATPVVIGSTVRATVTFDPVGVLGNHRVGTGGSTVVEAQHESDRSTVVLRATAMTSGYLYLAGGAGEEEVLFYGPRLTSVPLDELAIAVRAPAPVVPVATGGADLVYQVPAGAIQLAVTPRTTVTSMGVIDLRSLEPLRVTYPAGVQGAASVAPTDELTLTVAAGEHDLVVDWRGLRRTIRLDAR